MMTEAGKFARLAAAVAGTTGVALGAFGAHALEATLESAGRVDTWETAVLYHLLHAVALLVLSGRGALAGRTGLWAARFWALGILVFSGSLYLLCLSGATWLGAITPIGGAAFIAGWACLFSSAKGGTPPEPSA